MDYLQSDDDATSINTAALKQSQLEEYLDDISNLNDLSKRVRLLHTSLLYNRSGENPVKERVCYNAWQSFVKSIGGTINGYYDLGSAMGMSKVNLDFISTYSTQMKVDPVNIVLKVFAQHEHATLDIVIQAIKRMENYQILHYLEEPLKKLEEAYINTKEDSGIYSKSNNENIIRYKDITFNDLPPVLLKKDIAKKNAHDKIKGSDKNPKHPSGTMTIMTFTEIKKNGNPVLFLTFAEDGADTARNIKQYVKEWNVNPEVTIVTLNDYREEVLKNPGSYIRNCLEMANLVVPIITSEYINEISEHHTQSLDASGNLDKIYVNLIYQQIVNYYVMNGCYNVKVRSVIPKYSDIKVLIRGIAMHPMLTPWAQEDSFNEFFKAFLNID